MKKRQTYKEKRPWGSFTQFTYNVKTTVKILIVNPGQLLSDQRHRHREELWVPLDEGGYVVINGKKRMVSPQEEIIITVGTWHRVGCEETVSRPIRILEISFGDFDENDIERRDDIYNRI